jgi:hypothetical protein
LDESDQLTQRATRHKAASVDSTAGRIDQTGVRSGRLRTEVSATTPAPDNNTTVSQAPAPAFQASTVTDPLNPNTDASLPYQGNRPDTNPTAPAPTTTMPNTDTGLEPDSPTPHPLDVAVRLARS